MEPKIKIQTTDTSKFMLENEAKGVCGGSFIFDPDAITIVQTVTPELPQSLKVDQNDEDET